MQFGTLHDRKRGGTGQELLAIDIGGEGRHIGAWNVNPSRVVTRGARRGELIPHHVPGRADAIPFPDESVDLVIVERTPLRLPGLAEIRRVIAPGGAIVLRHAVSPAGDPHRFAIQILPGFCCKFRRSSRGGSVQETRFLVGVSVEMFEHMRNYQ
jgi:SAM-dependent methyltransferase